MNAPDLMTGLVFLGGLAAGWILRGGQRARLDDASPEHPRTAPAAHAEAVQDAELLNLVRNGDKIAAIKRYRELTGAGLKDSKDAIDRIGG